MDEEKRDKLKQAMAQIQAVLDEHDIGGYVLLYKEHQSEYLIAVEPSWSVMHWQGEDIRFKSELADFAGDEAKQRAHTEWTVGMLRHFADLCWQHAEIFEVLLEVLGTVLHIEHTDAEHIPHRAHPHPHRRTRP